MSRTIRSESAAHTDQIAYIQARAGTSANWRTVLALRDSKRTARQAHRTASAKTSSVFVGLALALMAVGAIAFRLQDACMRAAVEISSLLS